MFEITRRHFLSTMSNGIGGAALASMLPKDLFGSNQNNALGEQLLADYAPKAKRVIYLFMAGGPAQHDLFDYKPKLNEINGQDLPSEVRGNQRLTGMSGNQARLPLAGSQFKFAQHGKSGAWVSELLPHTAKVVDDLCFVKSLWTEAINHDPAMTFFQTGSQIAGRPSLGSWVTYGLGSVNENLPGFVVLATKKPTDQPLYARLWGTGFLDSRYQGVRFSSGKDAVFYLTNPDGVCKSGRRALLDKLSDLNKMEFEKELDPEIETRIAQYEMAYRMQTSVPEVTDTSGETQETKNLYGEDSQKPGTFAANCLLARRLAERGVRFIQLYHPGWDQHNNLPSDLKKQCKETDQGCAALITDLKRRGMLDDTLVVWNGEFGRTAYSQGKLTKSNYGRDHHPRCFTAWMAGGGVKSGITYGQTDDYGYNILDKDGNPIVKPSKDGATPEAIHVHDLHATILHQLGMDHTKLTHTFQGRRFRLTDVHGRIAKELLS